jgi:hypothetical protein
MIETFAQEDPYGGVGQANLLRPSLPLIDIHELPQASDFKLQQYLQLHQALKKWQITCIKPEEFVRQKVRSKSKVSPI